MVGIDGYGTDLQILNERHVERKLGARISSPSVNEERLPIGKDLKVIVQELNEALAA